MAVDTISTALPAVTPTDQAIYEVATGDSSAVITEFTIHLSQDAPVDLIELPVVIPTYVAGGNP